MLFSAWLDGLSGNGPAMARCTAALAPTDEDRREPGEDEFCSYDEVRTGAHCLTRLVYSLLMKIVLPRTSSFAARERAFVISFACMDTSVTSKMIRSRKGAIDR